MKNKFRILFLLAIVVAFASCSEDDPNTKAGFTFTPDENIQVGDTVYFTNTSTEAETYQWSFGDTETSTEEAPFHIYAEPGIYDVTLVATNGGIVNTITQQINVAVDFSYIINFGSYSGAKSTITAYNKYDAEVTNNYFKTVNGVDMTSNVQYACNYDGNIYFMGNNADGISWVNTKTFEQTANAISSDIIKPRYCVGYGDYLYVSCYGGDVWYDSSLGYIAKINLNTKSVEKIDLPGGPEGLEIIDGKLYVALRYGKSIGIVDLATEAVTNVDIPGQPVFFEKDSQDNLYVVISRNWNDSETQTGVGYFNTQTNTFEATYALDGIGNTYDNVIEANSDFTKLYVSYTTSTDYNTYVSTGSIAVFDVASKQFESSNFVDGIVGINGLQVVDDNIISFTSPSTTSNGKTIIYSKDGEKLEEYEVGISPILLIESK
uniref:PKD domain-containing protein n=1 Tax=uncultured Draconibacterium sp. TaxID=1573823 RepID=UPI0032175E3B